MKWGLKIQTFTTQGERFCSSLVTALQESTCATGETAFILASVLLQALEEMDLREPEVSAHIRKLMEKFLKGKDHV